MNAIVPMASHSMDHNVLLSILSDLHLLIVLLTVQNVLVFVAIASMGMNLGDHSAHHAVSAICKSDVMQNAKIMDCTAVHYVVVRIIIQMRLLPAMFAIGQH